LLRAEAAFAVAKVSLIAFALESLLAIAEQTLGIGVAIGQGATSI
jgi:hypothetical protein